MGISNTAGVGLCILGEILVCIFVFLRLWVRWKYLRIISASDGFIIAAWIFYTYLIIGDIICEAWGQWQIPLITADQIAVARKIYNDDRKVKTMMVILWSSGGAYFAVLYCVKAAFLLFYYVLFPKSLKGLRWVLHATCAICFVCFWVTEGLILFGCRPIKYTWMFEDHCEPYTNIASYYFAVCTHLITDFLIYMMPFWLLPHLMLKGRQRIGVIGMFLLGFLNLCVGVIRVVVIGHAFQQAAVNALAAIEMCTAIMVACSPPLKWLICSRNSPSNGIPSTQQRYYEDRERSSATGASRSIGRRVRDNDELLTDDMDVLEWGTYVAKPREGETVMGRRASSQAAMNQPEDMDGILVTSTTEMTATRTRDFNSKEELIDTPLSPAHITNGAQGRTFVTADGRYAYGWEISKQVPRDNVRAINDDGSNASS